MPEIKVNGTKYLDFTEEQSGNLIKALSRIYYIFYDVELEHDSFVKYHASRLVSDFTDRFVSAHDCLQAVAKALYVPEHQKLLADFYDTAAWPERLKEKDTEYVNAMGIKNGWIRTNLIVAVRDEKGTPTHVFVAIQNVNETMLKDLEQTKKMEAQLEEISALNAQLEDNQAEMEAQLEEISALNDQLEDNQTELEAAAAEQESQMQEINALNAEMLQLLNTDALTKLLNRRAYETEFNSWDALPEDLVYIAFDVNELKHVNDFMGHAAGDELLIGAADCLREGFGKYGKIFRIGGDEFAAILHISVDELGKAGNEFKRVVSGWTGKLVDKLHIAMGYSIAAVDKDCSSMQQMSILADKRMYENKAEYYKQSGVDRRKR